jgi:hypothetical protein
VVGVVLARAHGQSIDPRILHGYCAGANAGDAPFDADSRDGADGVAFDAAFEEFAVAYADQTEADHAAFVKR